MRSKEQTYRAIERLPVKIASEVVRQVLEHAKRDAPLEACGYLAERDGIVAASYPLSNMDRSSEHFSFDPREQFTVMRDARSKNLEIRAVYHSHPHTPARPSAEDKKLAYDPAMLYAIVSLADGQGDMKIFKIKGDAVEEIALEVIDDDRI